MLHYSSSWRHLGRPQDPQVRACLALRPRLRGHAPLHRDTLGLAETGTGKGGRIVFFSAGVHHHDLSCEQARADGPAPQPKGVPGLYHIAFDVGSSLANLAAARGWLEARGLKPFGETSNSFSVSDPDGNQIELCVDLVS